jgi:hypothetical protein
MDGGGAVLGLGLTGCLRLGAILAFLAGWDVAWDLPLLRVSTMVRVRVWRKMDIRVRVGVERIEMLDLVCMWVKMKVNGDGLMIGR